MKKFLLANIAIVMAVLISACGTASTPAPTPTPTLDPVSPTINIILDEYTFTPDHIKLKVGQNVTFHIVNQGVTGHELMIGRNPLRAEDGTLGDGFEHDFFAVTKPDVSGDVEVMGMEDSSMGDMATGTETPEVDMSTMEMGTATPEGTMEMEIGTPGSDTEDMGHLEMKNGFMVMFQPEQEATVTFTVTEDMLGAWTMGCFEGDDNVHFDQGMAGILYVVP